MQRKRKPLQQLLHQNRFPLQNQKKPVAPGSAGHVKRFDVSDKEAAMVMAVVAYQMKKPLNELRFLSIKEVKNDEV